MSDVSPDSLLVIGKKRRGGHKPRSDSAGVMCQVRFRMSTTEKDRTFKAARVNHQSFSSFVRDAIADATEECMEIEPIPREAKRS